MNQPCIFCHPPPTDPPQTPGRYRSPCCSFWRCWGFWWQYDPRREWCLCRAWASWRFSWWRRSHLWRPPPPKKSMKKQKETEGKHYQMQESAFTCVSIAVSNLRALSCAKLARSPVTHPEPSCTPRNYHWKSSSNIRSGRLAWWLFLGCCRRPVAVGWISPSTENSLPKRLNLNQTRFNPITRISFFSGAPPTSPPSDDVNPSIPSMAPGTQGMYT